MLVANSYKGKIQYSIDICMTSSLICMKYIDVRETVYTN